MKNKYSLFLFGFILVIISCNTQDQPTIVQNIETNHSGIITKFNTDYDQLPEQKIAVGLDSLTYAQYINPTTEYNHGILGDNIEAKGLLVYQKGNFIELTLTDQYVFEDITPRLVDINNDGKPEVICIRTNLKKGAGIVIYQVLNDKLTEYAYVKEISTPNRWLNIVSVYDLDNDNALELAWVQTPHIGGILKVGRIKLGEITSLDEYPTVSNHAIGETNLCLSALHEENDQINIFVPSQNRDQILSFGFSNNQLSILKDTSIIVDFTTPIYDQLPETDLLNDNNCRFGN